MRHQDTINAWIMAVLAGLVVIGAAVAWFSDTLHLDWATGARLLMGLILWGVAFWFLRQWVGDKGLLLTAAVAGLWLCLWPALTSWKEQRSSPFPGYVDPELSNSWLFSTSMKIEVLVAILLLGYGIRFWRER